jgi:hypothetical protein
MPKDKALTVYLDLTTYTEITAAAIVHRHRTLAGFMKQVINDQITEAKAMVGPAEFQRVASMHRVEIQHRSVAKALERERSLKKTNFSVAPHDSVTIKKNDPEKIPKSKKKTGTGG